MGSFMQAYSHEAGNVAASSHAAFHCFLPFMTINAQEYEVVTDRNTDTRAVMRLFTSYDVTPYLVAGPSNVMPQQSDQLQPASI